MSSRPRRLPIPAVALAAVLALSGCATDLFGTGGGPAQDDRAARTAQLMRLAETTRAGGDLSSAAMFQRRAHDLSPDDPAPLTALAAVLAEAGAHRQAVEAYREALARNPDLWTARTDLGAALLALDQPEEALTEFAAVLAPAVATAVPDALRVRALNGSGIASDMLARHEQAQGFYLRALDLTPDGASLRNNLGLSLALGGAAARAVEVLEALADRPEAEPRHLMNLALALGLAGEDGRAAEVAGRVLDPAAVANNLAFYRSLGQMTPTDRAAAVLRRNR